MKFKIVTTGKIKEDFIVNGIKEFYSRINRYTQLDLFPVKEEKMTAGVTDSQIVLKEGKRMLSKVPQDGLWVALDRQGQEMSSVNHFDFLNKQANLGIRKIYYLIGGPLGLSPEVKKRADTILSLSRLTLTHEMSALILMEQIYRYLNFMAGEKYHK
jgi:23S rRNA (pseudouridine1915-N3)-methyltransferase